MASFLLVASTQVTRVCETSCGFVSHGECLGAGLYGGRGGLVLTSGIQCLCKLLLEVLKMFVHALGALHSWFCANALKKLVFLF